MTARDSGTRPHRLLPETGNFGTGARVADALGCAPAEHFGNRYAERFGHRPR